MTEATVFHNLISEVTSHYFCHILFIRSESQSPARAQGEGTTQGVNARRQESMAAVSEASTTDGFLPEIFIT